MIYKKIRQTDDPFPVKFNPSANPSISEQSFGESNPNPYATYYIVSAFKRAPGSQILFRESRARGY